MENNYKLLLVDDEPDILEFMSYNLRMEGYKVYTAPDGESGIQTALQERPHLILLDVMMPGKSGIEVCEEIRTHRLFDNTIVAFLSARAEDYSQIAGFNAGADDYLTKPIGIKVLKARIATLLKRSKMATTETEVALETEETSDTAEINPNYILIDKQSYSVFKNGKSINLPRREFELLLLLTSKPEHVFYRKEIFDTVWGKSTVVNARTIDVHIRRLREKIGNRHIKTLKGIGYMYAGE